MRNGYVIYGKISNIPITFFRKETLCSSSGGTFVYIGSKKVIHASTLVHVQQLMIQPNKTVFNFFNHVISDMTDIPVNIQKLIYECV